MERRKTFVFSREILEAVERMDNNNALDFLKGIINYGLNGIEPVFQDKVCDMAFMFSKAKIDYYQEKY